MLCVGYSNAYFHYVTTPEEYDEQRYEGGSTLFGRWQLPALMQTAASLPVLFLGCRAQPCQPIADISGAQGVAIVRPIHW